MFCNHLTDAMSYAITILTTLCVLQCFNICYVQQHNISIHVHNGINFYLYPRSYRRLTAFHVSIIEKELMYAGVKKDMRKKVIYQLDEITIIPHQYQSNPMGGHSGIKSTLAKVSLFYTWNGIKKDVIEYAN